MDDRLVNYGDQVVIEGVLMRGRYTWALAMRSPGGSIITTCEVLGGVYKTNLARIPYLRGLIPLWDSFGLGLHVLMESANLQTAQVE